MTAMMMMDKSMVSPMGMPMSGSQMPAAAPNGPQMCMVPRCTMKIEKCKGGMKMTCTCEDEVAAGTLQNMCKMMAGSLCSCCCMMNGMMVCNCCLTMCKCECTDTKMGVCITCTSGDEDCAAMCQACCDCVSACMKAGCMCCVCFGGMPVCCCC
jgi:hypothetical protein